MIPYLISVKFQSFFDVGMLRVRLAVLEMNAQSLQNIENSQSHEAKTSSRSGLDHNHETDPHVQS